MSKIIIYSKTVCPYCVKAKNLLEMLGAKYEEINLDNNPDAMVEMLEKTKGARSVPQIFIGDKHIGGCDDMYALHEKEELKPLL